ncbi:efflux RND transporter permease subunit [Brachybacterium huguangmaarense]|uniref:Efflux RND transporter permease subunit n=1 Tax=Brachybacterium huguangmaarense TaxID=1652028 RepID=A0ABY6G2I3_9MICO|nr:efflux RND transporter permease subunit [Brachybacterium huguangmaarense]UYG17420.1 efflux RND transporter permease subunit [Brachybacterium huguangmaarense]
MRRLATVSLANRSFIALVCIAVAVIGAISMTSLRQELIPSVSLPQIQIVTTSPGSTSEQVSSRLSTPIEQSVRGLENVEKTSSTSQPGVSMVTVELTYGTDVARSANQVDAALGRIEDQLPDDADPQVISGGSGDIPAAVLSISSDNDPAVLAERLRNDVVPELERVDGVSSVALAGAPTQIVQITPDEAKLAAEGLTDSDITTALDNDGLSVPGGTVTDGDRSLDVSVGDPLTSLDDLKGIVVMPSSGGAGDEAGQGQDEGQGQDGAAPSRGTGSVVTLGEVATVEQTQQEATSISRTNGRESLVLVVTATADGNVVDVSHDVEATLKDTLPGVGGDATSDVVFDQAPFIQKSIVSLAEEGLLGLIFAIGVILLFLRALRPTIVTAISIPLSLLMAFVGMLVSGYTLNMLTLAALTISIGRVVDDSIVVIENITRHLTYGKARHRAIIDAVGEVAGAVTSSTLATVIVFLPVAIVSGMAGELFRPFSLTVAIAMLSSLIVSLTIVPVLAYWFLRVPKNAIVPADPDDAAEVERVRAAAEEREERTWLHRVYAPVLRWTQAGLGHRLITLGAALAILVATVFMIPLLKINFLGDSGQNLASYTQTLPAGTSLEDTSAEAAAAEKALQDVSGVQTVQTTIGASAFGRAGGGGATNEISYSITTDEDADQETVRAHILSTLQGLPGAGDVEEQDSASVTGSSSVDILITGPTAEARQKANDAILAELDPLPADVEKVGSDLEADQPTAVVTVDRDKAAQRGLTEKAVVGLVAQQLYPSSIGSIELDGQDLDIYLEQGEKVSTLDQLRSMQIAGMPLTDVATVGEAQSRPQIATQDTRETVTISLTPTGDDVGAVSSAAQAAIDKADLPEGAEATLGGTASDIGDTFGQLGIAMLAAVLLTYVLLVWIFKSLVQPLILLVSIPFAATGALGLLLITRVPLGLPSMIGLLMLVGIVVTNAIVLIDLVNQYRRRGAALDEAIHLGASKRLRPILMTAAATIFALLPMALGITGEGGFISQPLAVVVIGGLVTSTLLTLVIVPVLYRIAEGPGERRRLREAAAGTGQDAADDGAVGAAGQGPAAEGEHASATAADADPSDADGASPRHGRHRADVE